MRNPTQLEHSERKSHHGEVSRCRRLRALAGEASRWHRPSHAGTGFGITSAIAWPLDDRDVNFSADRVGRRQFIGKQSYGYLELQQYGYDGKTFRVTSQQKVFRTENLNGWNLMERPIRNGIPDGDDLLLAFSAKEKSARRD